MSAMQIVHLFAYVILAAIVVGLICGSLGRLANGARSSADAQPRRVVPVRTAAERAEILAERELAAAARDLGFDLLDTQCRPWVEDVVALRRAVARDIKLVDDRCEQKIAAFAGDDWRTDEWPIIEAAATFAEVRELVAA
jgi:hypothetical protein